jgi:hypothetical protein
MVSGFVWYFAIGIAVVAASFYVVPASEHGVTAFDVIRDVIIVLFLGPLIFLPAHKLRRPPQWRGPARS